MKITGVNDSGKYYTNDKINVKDEDVGHKGWHATGQNAHGQICPIRRFYYAHTFLRCFLVVATCSASMLENLA